MLLAKSVILDLNDTFTSKKLAKKLIELFIRCNINLAGLKQRTRGLSLLTVEVVTEPASFFLPS
ncbi:MAG TPA: hypothetical protein DCK79_10020 [Candidatus Atribacteria bacterium]|jgi:hypothetical protein|nr:hypothetical protein [Candidatus Atribacteria bacterium]